MAGQQQSEAEQVARALIEHFLQLGLFDGVESSASSVVPAAATSLATHKAVAGFYGLSVRGVGYTEGELVEPRCYVYLTRSTRKHEKNLPDRVGDVPVVMRKVGSMQVKPELASATAGSGYAHQSADKVTCGVSIAPGGAPLAGTLGAYLRNSDGGTYLLSNNHVIGGCNHLPMGHPITAPSGIDVRPGSPPIIQVATLSTLRELRSGAHTYVPTQRTDAALASVTSRERISSMQGTYYDTPEAVASPVAGMVVQKVGRTTRHTVGRVESKVPYLLPIPYKSKDFTAMVNFAEVWVVASTSEEPFALQGDSGALVVNEDASAAVGLLFASSNDGQRAFVTSLPDALHDLGGKLSLISGVR